MEPRLRGSVDSTSSLRGNPLRRGILAAAVDRDLGSLCPVLSLLPSSEYSFTICVRAGIVRVSVGLLGLGRTFFIIGGVGRLFLRLRVGFAMVYRWDYR